MAGRPRQRSRSARGEKQKAIPSCGGRSPADSKFPRGPTRLSGLGPRSPTLLNGFRAQCLYEPGGAEYTAVHCQYKCQSTVPGMPRSRRQVAKTRKTQRTPRRRCGSHKFNLFVVDLPGGALPVGPRPSALTWHMHLKRWRRLRVRAGRLRHHRPQPWTPPTHRPVRSHHCLRKARRHRAQERCRVGLLAFPLGRPWLECETRHVERLLVLRPLSIL